MAEPLADEGGEETGVPGENPLATSFNKMPVESSPKRDSSPHSSIGGRLGTQMCKPLHHASRQLRRVYGLKGIASLL